jgi:hypothetical protein
MAETETSIDGWAILELMGHRRLGGRVSEATIAGGDFIRIDVPHPNESGVFTAAQFYSPAAVYAITPTTEEVACAIARAVPGHPRSPSPEPFLRRNLRALTASTSENRDDHGMALIRDDPDDARDDGEEHGEPSLVRQGPF